MSKGKQQKARAEVQIKLMAADLYDEILHDSDRAAAILSGTVLDNVLELVLRDFLIDHESEVDLLFGLDRPLATFSARIRLAYCVGLLTVSEYHDLNRVRIVRNRFAHGLQGITFDDHEVIAHCNELRILKEQTHLKNPRDEAEYLTFPPFEDMPNRLRFTLTTLALLARLSDTGIRIGQHGMKRTISTDNDALNDNPINR